jgi:DNA-binding MarR family transcriptional regulator
MQIYDRERSGGYLTNWAARLFIRALEQRLGGTGSGPMPIFFALQDGAALTQKELAKRAAVEQPTMAATLSRMERDGLIARAPDPSDGRSSLIRLTPAGNERAARALEAAIEINDHIEGALGGPAEYDRFVSTMQRVIAALERDTERNG